ncbi:MAG TPA: carboxypeptidase-like regulatory domain-containing protein [Bryobacteraceae bacterium]|nr:carboxypeptidase-like regulatory domain-containing protein [Bryobacteraceae bacterium]
MRPVTIALSVLICSAELFAQAGTGTITGIITDPAGASIAGANVEVRNTETNAPYPTVTTETGAYTVPRLPPGPYSVTVTASGFKKLTRSGLTVDAGQTIPLDLMLQVGETTESVTVQAEATLLKTESGDIAHDITLEQLDDLPILGIGTANAGSLGIRNPFNSVQLLPGVSYFANFNMIINGAPTNTAAYRLEGLDFTNHVTPPNNFAIQQSQPSADAIQEMAIQTSNYAPEFGQAGGGLFNIIMKSGTNQFHGSAYEYFVNEALNAGDPFSFNAGTPGAPSGGKYRPFNRRNDWGGTFGGPVWIPKLYNGKDKTFFFFAYERYKESQALTFPDTLPNAQYQAGNFSAISPAGGAGFNPTLGVPATAITTVGGQPVFANEIFDPLSRTTANGQVTATPFPNNVIPQSRFSPVAVAIQSFLPPLSNGNLVTNYTGFNDGVRITSVPSIKVDQIIGPKQKLSLYFHNSVTNAQYTTPNGNADGLPPLLTAARGSIPIGGPAWRANYDYTITPTLLLHLGAGYSYIYFFDDGPYTKSGKTVNCQTMLDLQGCEGSFNFPTIVAGNVTSPQALGGMQQLGNALAHTHTRVERPAANANMTWVRGNHTFKAGAEVWWQAFIQAPPTGVGLYFANLTNLGVQNSSMGSVTNLGAGATAYPAALVTGAYQTGFPYANFLLGDVTQATQYAPVDSRMGKSQWGVFIQDDWKVTRKLTVNYGLRWDYGTLNTEEHGRSADLGLNVPNPAAGGRLGAAIFQATCHCSFGSAYPYAIGPRFGIAYQIDSKTVFRGGWGFAYDPALDLTLQNTANVSNTATGINNYLPLNTPGTIPQPVWPNFDPGQTPLPGFTTSGFLQYIDPHAARPGRQNQWSIGVQREITANTLIEASYVGNRGVWWTGGATSITGGSTVGPYGYINQVAPSVFSAYGLNPYTNPADNLLLGDALSNPAVISRVGNIVPYSGYSTSNTLINALRPYPQFSTITVYNSPTGNTWYDSLQMKATKRLSHGLQVFGTFTWSKAMVGIRPNLYVPSVKSLQTTDQPFLFNTNIVYTTQKWFNNRFVAAVTKDWAIGAFLQYGSGLPLTPPTATNINYIGGSEYFRVPGQPLYTKNLNCGCINPYTDVVLNPAAWANPANGAFGPALGTLYGDFRQARRPDENMNLSRTFRFKERLALELRGEFVNIFNRTQIGNPSTVAPGAPVSHNNYGQLTSGFGVINLTVPGAQSAPSTTLNAVVGQLYSLPRTGTLIARFTF